MPLGPNDLVLCSGTLRAASIAEKCAAAAAGGFSALTLWPTDVERAKREGFSLADVRRMIADHGLAVADVEPLLVWLPGEDVPFDVPAEAELYEIADGLGARSINAVQGFGTTVDVDRAAEALAGVCDRAREHGLLVTLEYLPWSGIPDAATALAIALRCGRANASILFDTWHTFRGPTDDAQLEKISGARIGSVQINDAPAEPEQKDLVAETMTARRLPGEGAIPLARWLRWLDAIGSTAPIGVEVFSSALDALPPIEVGRRCGAAARAVIA
ncbi:MAG: sugar phosphate isomerase/epimerase family protein, partial [Myxococcota bacterium]